jgi:hypothetical protein
MPSGTSVVVATKILEIPNIRAFLGPFLAKIKSEMEKESR